MPYQKVSIDQLQPGSYVVQVLEQTGELEIKHAGWVRSREAISALKNQGVRAVAIDPAKQLVSSVAAKTVTTEPEPAAFRAIFADEQPRAERCLEQGKKLQQQVLDAAAKAEPIDLSLVHEVSAGFSDAVSRNPDVLLCLSRIATQSDLLLQHSINCAVYMAAFARFLNYPKHKVQALITASLLHDVGKAQNPTLLTQPDADAISTSLAVLQQSSALAGDISLWISQHCAYLDGSGSPPIQQQQIDMGSRMLNIVNLYEQLSAPQQGYVNPLIVVRQLLAKAPQQLDNDLLQLFIKCVGIYPPGTVVKLSTGKLALVLENNAKKPTAPKVKVFYHSVHHHHIPPKVLDLARQQEEQIEACIDLKKYGLEVRNYL
ncbi:HD-GYP domain-containing protein [Alishewanella tabrizica]|uniref:Phosphodiesterase n=1 Tax=Alishewanella tabrizica TaxID=671278 RepID=A0ABQ2WH85_9ALTE|nr:HD-GYP domain-containing protein [Alishewanella tabrizica]GGW56217.1 phosphodiesterase [Alishewanella tabrizica]